MARQRPSSSQLFGRQAPRVVTKSICIGDGAAGIMGCRGVDILVPDFNAGRYAHGEKQADNQHHQDRTAWLALSVGMVFCIHHLLGLYRLRRLVPSMPGGQERFRKLPAQNFMGSTRSTGRQKYGASGHGWTCMRDRKPSAGHGPAAGFAISCVGSMKFRYHCRCSDQIASRLNNWSEPPNT